MCIDDWRLGRFIRWEWRELTTSASWVQFLNADSQRVAVAVANPHASAILYVSPVNPAGGTAHGFTLASDGNPSLFLSLATHGDVVQQILYWRQVSATSNALVGEAFLPTDVLDQTLADLARR